jgi:hypothetical protein
MALRAPEEVSTLFVIISVCHTRSLLQNFRTH